MPSRRARKPQEVQIKRDLPDPELVLVDEEAEAMMEAAMQSATSGSPGVEQKQKNIQELLDELDEMDLTDPDVLADYVGDMMLTGLLAHRDVSINNPDSNSKTEALVKLDDYVKSCIATLGFIPSKTSAKYLLMIGRTMPPAHPNNLQVMTSLANVGSHFAIITRETMILRRQLLKVDEDKATL